MYSQSRLVGALRRNRIYAIAEILVLVALAVAAFYYGAQLVQALRANKSQP